MTETLKKGTRVTGADRAKLAADLKKRYDSGESIRALAATTGRSYGFVLRGSFGSSDRSSAWSSSAQSSAA